MLKQQDRMKLSFPPHVVAKVRLRQSAKALREMRAVPGPSSAEATEGKRDACTTDEAVALRACVNALEAEVAAMKGAQVRRARQRIAGLDAERPAPVAVITSRWVHTACALEPQKAVVLKLPLWQRVRQWLRSE